MQIDPKRLAMVKVVIQPSEGHEPTDEEWLKQAELSIWRTAALVDSSKADGIPTDDVLTLFVRDLVSAGFKEAEARDFIKEVLGRRPTAFDTTDLANAHRLVKSRGKDLRFVPEWGWMGWDGRRWVQDDGRVLEAAKGVSALIAAEAREHPDLEKEAAEAAKKAQKLKDSPAATEQQKAEAAQEAKRLKTEAAKSERKRLMAWANKSEAAPRIAAMVTLAQSDPMIRASAEDFDTHPWLLNVENGTIDLKSGELRPHRREDLLTLLSPVAYDPDAKAPRFERFVNEIMAGNKNLVAYLRRVVGYTITGSVDERAFIIMYGRMGSNGKSVLGEVLAAAMGDYATTIPSNVLMTEKSGGGKHRATPELAKLKGVRLAAASEGNAGQQLDSGQLKEWAGDDTLTARELYRRPVEFVPQFKIWFRTNFLPKLSPSDTAAWSRVHVLPFTQQFERNTTLKSTLLAELPGILAWAVRGATEWQLNGLAPPPEVKKAVEEYRRELDVVGRFLEERTRPSPTGQIGATLLHDLYVKWCEEGHERPWGYRAFKKDLEDRSYISHEKTEKGMVFKGLEATADNVEQEVDRWKAVSPPWGARR